MIDVPTVLENVGKPNALSADKDYVPFCAWRNVIFSDDIDENNQPKTRVLPPMIAISWGPIIQLFELTMDFSIVLKRTIDVNADVISVQWVSENVLVALDAQRNAFVIDTDNQDFLYEKFFSQVNILNHESFVELKKDTPVSMKTYTNIISTPANGITYLLVCKNNWQFIQTI